MWHHLWIAVYSGRWNNNNWPDDGVDVGLEDGGVEAKVVDGGPQVVDMRLPILGKEDWTLQIKF